jgi:hypothetical protein
LKYVEHDISLRNAASPSPGRPQQEEVRSSSQGRVKLIASPPLEKRACDEKVDQRGRRGAALVRRTAEGMLKYFAEVQRSQRRWIDGRGIELHWNRP